MAHVMFLCALLNLSATSSSAQALAQPPGERIAIPAHLVNTDYVIIGELLMPLGTVTTVQGVAIESRLRKHLGTPMLRVQRIGGDAVISDIQIPLTPDLVNPDDGAASPSFELGSTYELIGYETGGFEGIPEHAFDGERPRIATTIHHFACRFVIIRGRPIDPVRFAPADFVGRETLLSGRARSRDGASWIAGEGWDLLVDAAAPWEADFEGKETEAHGALRLIHRPGCTGWTADGRGWCGLRIRLGEKSNCAVWRLAEPTTGGSNTAGPRSMSRAYSRW